LTDGDFYLADEEKIIHEAMVHLGSREHLAIWRGALPMTRWIFSGVESESQVDATTAHFCPKAEHFVLMSSNAAIVSQ
jgi:hypothetical protein